MNIEAINALKLKEQTFWLELSSGRILQIYDPNSVATCFGAGLAKGKVGILRNNGFEIVTSEAIIACGAGEHAQTSDALEKRRAEMRARFGE